MTKVLLLGEPGPGQPIADAVVARLPDVPVVAYRRGIGDAELAGVDVVLGWRMPTGLAQRLPQLRWICSIAAGVEKLLVPGLAPQVVVSRIVDADQAIGIAQFVVLMALHHARGLATYEAQQRDRVWQRAVVATARHEVTVLGTGAMGGEIVRQLEAVGFAVTGWSRRTGGPLESRLAASDIVVCALPLTAETEGLLDARRFAQMRRGAFLINVARGAHVVEADLVDAVRAGRLAGAALDVQRHEPMAADDPLWDVPGIVITPHVAAQSSAETIADQFVEGLRCVERGEAPPRRVDRSRGY